MGALVSSVRCVCEADILCSVGVILVNRMFVNLRSYYGSEMFTVPNVETLTSEIAWAHERAV